MSKYKQKWRNENILYFVDREKGYYINGWWHQLTLPQPMIKSVGYFGWKTQAWNLLVVDLNSWTHFPPSVTDKILAWSSVKDAMYLPESSQHIERTGFS